MGTDARNGPACGLTPHESKFFSTGKLKLRKGDAKNLLVRQYHDATGKKRFVGKKNEMKRSGTFAFTSDLEHFLEHFHSVDMPPNAMICCSQKYSYTYIEYIYI